MKEQKEQLNWLAILRGWGVLLVVIFHSFTYEENALTPILSLYNMVFDFRMPLFFFISGFLLYYTKVRNGSDFVSVLKTRVPRIIYPYLSLTLLVFLLKIAFVFLVKRPVDFSFQGLLDCFLYPINNPSRHLWFLNAILIYFLCYPIVKIGLKNKYTIFLSLIILLALYLFVPKIYFLGLSEVSKYFIFFFTGAVFSKYDLQQYLKNKLAAILVFGLFVFEILFDFSFILHSLTGIYLSICFALLSARIFPNLFYSFRNYYYQIYLLSSIFQSFITYGYVRVENNFLLLLLIFAIATITGLYLPILVAKIVKRIDWKPLLLILGYQKKIY